MSKPDQLLWLSDSRGVYIPRDFALSFTDRSDVSGVTAEQWEILEDSHHTEYWETWDEVLDDAIVTDEKGVQYRLYQQGDLWLIPIGMEWDEETDDFVWRKEDIE